MVAISGDALAHRLYEPWPAVSADSELWIGCNIGREDCPERRLERQPSGKIFVPRRCMAGCAIAKIGDIRATLNRGCVAVPGPSGSDEKQRNRRAGE
jgi:hypothetical protein